MNLNDVTMRNFGRYQALLDKYDEAEFVDETGADGKTGADEEDEPQKEFAPLLRCVAVILAAREAGIAEGLNAPLDKGNPIDLLPTAANREAILDAAVEIIRHIKTATDPLPGEA